MNSQDFHAPLWSERHPSVAHFESLFAYEHLPPHLQAISEPFTRLALHMVYSLPDGPELSAGPTGELVKARRRVHRAYVRLVRVRREGRAIRDQHAPGKRGTR